jgi:transposase
VAGLDPARLVFLDETAVQNNLTRLWGRAPVGERCVDLVPFGRFTTSTLVAAMRLSGPIKRATVLLNGTVNGDVFDGYAERLLAKATRPGDVVVMDNLNAHHGELVRAAVEHAGATLLHLPPYSPDLNPIEKLFAKLKTYLRALGARTFDTLTDAIRNLLNTITRHECEHYFQSCGYATVKSRTL